MMAIGTGDNNGLPSSLDRKYRRLLLYARISTLAMLSYYEQDGNQEGLPYQDIKDALGLEDGSLGPNLIWLKKEGYIRSSDTRLGDKTVVVYYIEENGKKAYEEIKSWIVHTLHLNEKNEIL
jgi:DNA-binding MarR family transcriptional regulator